MNEEVAEGELVDRLTAIGVEEREAKLFVHLLLHGPTRASDAAAAARLKRTETYRALEALMKRGFVTAHLTKPVVYEAVHPEALFAELLAGHEQRRSELEGLRERVVEAHAQARDERESGGSRYGYKIIQGRRALLTATEPMVRTARSSIIMVSTTFSATSVTAQNRAYHAMLRRANEGLPVRLLIVETPGVETALQHFLSQRSAQVRFFTAEHPVRFIAADSKEIVYWLVSDPSQGIEGREDIGMWTNAPDFVRAQETLFENLWRAGRPVR